MEKIKLEDYKDKPKELIGRYVLVNICNIEGGGKRIEKISTTVKTGVKTDSGIYEWSSGYLRGRGTYSTTNAELITNEYAEQLRKEWREKKEKKKLIEVIKSKINNEDFETVKKIHELLSPNK